MFLACHSGAFGQPPASPVTVVRSALSVPDGQLTYARAKLAFDQIIDPTLGADSTLAEIDRLSRSASAIAGANASPTAKLTALRQVIYESGEWNGGRPFTTKPILLA